MPEIEEQTPTLTCDFASWLIHALGWPAELILTVGEETLHIEQKEGSELWLASWYGHEDGYWWDIFEKRTKAGSGMDMNTEQAKELETMIASGMEALPKAVAALRKIVNMIDAPHFDAKRKYQIREIAVQAIRATGEDIQ